MLTYMYNSGTLIIQLTTEIQETCWLKWISLVTFYIILCIKFILKTDSVLGLYHHKICTISNDVQYVLIL